MDHDLKSKEGKKSFLRETLEVKQQRGASILSSFHQSLIRFDRGVSVTIDENYVVQEVGFNINKILGVTPEQVIGANMSVVVGQEQFQETLDEINTRGIAIKEVNFNGHDLYVLTWKIPNSNQYAEYLIKK